MGFDVRGCSPLIEDRCLGVKGSQVQILSLRPSTKSIGYVGFATGTELPSGGERSQIGHTAVESQRIPSETSFSLNERTDREGDPARRSCITVETRDLRIVGRDRRVWRLAALRQLRT